MRWTRSASLMGAALVALGLVNAPPAAAAEDTLVMAWATDATGLDPHKQTAFASLRLLELIYEPLVTLSAELTIEPALAESWAFAEDATQLTFTLREATFQNGEPVTSADVKASFERILDEATGAATRANFLSIEGIETPDERTVVFQLSQPDAPILTAMTDLNAAIVPASAIASGAVGTEAVGSGPFVLDEWKPNEGAALSANAGWWGEGPAVAGIEIRVIPDESAILAALRAEQIDFALLNDPIVASLVAQAGGNVQLNRAPALSYHVLQLNPSRPPMDDLKVRQAISCAIDRQQVLDTASLGEGQVTGPLTIPAYRVDPAGLFCYQQDVARAKALLAEAGAENLAFKVIAATGEPPTAAAEAQNIQAQLAAIGIELEIEILELNVYVDRWLAADFDMAVAQNSGRADPYTMYTRYWTQEGNLQKVSNYIDDTLDQLMQEGRVATDPAARQKIFADFQSHLVEMAPWIWLYNGYEYTAQQPWVKGFVPMPNDSLYGLARVSLER